MDDDLDNRYRAVIVHLGLQLARARLGPEAKLGAVMLLAQEEIRHGYELAGMPLTPETRQ